jgi:RecB family exonuclease
MRPLSYTQIATYRACPLQYKLQYLDGLKPKDKWYFSFGSTLHRCTEYFFRVKVPPPPSLAELIDFYQRNWLAQGYESAEEEARYRAYGQEILSEFWRLHQADFRIPVAVERMFSIDIAGIKLRGYIDRVDKLDSGGLSIVDYKTSQNLFTGDDLDQDLQLTLYQLAVERIWQLPVERLTLYHLRSNTPCSCGPRDSAALDAARELVTEVAESIAQGRFPAIEHEYCPCDFPEHCPYYRHQYLAAQSERACQEMLPGLAVGEAVEKYVLLQAQAKELKTQLEELKQVIIDFCQTEGLSRVCGEEHAVTVKLVERMGFAEDEVRALLEPCGLWPRVLGFDDTRIDELIRDETVAREVREKLGALRRAISASPRLSVKRITPEE